jgi:uncharacterized Ntn-hydrolase superfamily protein
MTYSIVARDPQTGEMGVAVQSHWFAAGNVVPWAEAGVGAVATQATAEISYGPHGLDLMRAGATAHEALDELLARDTNRDVRQVAMIDAIGNVATHTGSSTIPEAGHTRGPGFSCQANMMWAETVWDAMASAYSGATGDLASRLLDALDAAEGERGDIRGRQAAGILIVGPDPLEEPWRGVRMHLHTDDHAEPLADLRRIVDLHRAYERLESAEEFALADDQAGAARAVLDALRLAPGSDEVRFWSAIGMASSGMLNEAGGLIRQAFASDPGWEELLRRLVSHKLVELDPEVAERLLAVGLAGAG